MIRYLLFVEAHVNLLDSAQSAIVMTATRASDAALDPGNALYTGGLLALGLAVFLFLRRGSAPQR